VAAGDCLNCHDVHASNARAQLVATGNELCYMCHDDKSALAQMAHVHPPVEEGCVACHSPHSGPQAFMLPEKGDALCLLCHPDIGDKAKNAPVKHAALEEGCTSCHDPHGNGNLRLLQTEPQGFCVSCHDAMGEVVAAAKFQHQPVQKGECWLCHDPHGAENRVLLKQYYPEEFYAAFDEANYALCFSCHDRRAFLYQRTSELTRFRNGDQNLHYQHVNKSTKGRVCKTCHGVHGADQATLVQSKIPGFGKWEIPIQYTQTPNGGNCTVGCHKPKAYSRNRAVRNE